MTIFVSKVNLKFCFFVALILEKQRIRGLSPGLTGQIMTSEVNTKLKVRYVS